MSAYIDTSALAAYYMPEAITDEVQALLKANPIPTISELVHLELYSALAIRVRTDALPSEDAERIKILFEEHVRDGLYFKDALTPLHFEQARAWIGRFDLPLKGPDGLHLVLAVLGDKRLVTADQQLARNAERIGAAVHLVGA